MQVLPKHQTANEISVRVSNQRMRKRPRGRRSLLSGATRRVPGRGRRRPRIRRSGRFMSAASRWTRSGLEQLAERHGRQPAALRGVEDHRHRVGRVAAVPAPARLRGTSRRRRGVEPRPPGPAAARLAGQLSSGGCLAARCRIPLRPTRRVGIQRGGPAPINHGLRTPCGARKSRTGGVPGSRHEQSALH